MKLHAIVNSGKRLKDFADIYTILEYIPLEVLYNAYEKKYYPNVNRQMAQAGLLYHAEINFSAPTPLLIKTSNWAEIQMRLKDAIINPKKVFLKPKDSNKKQQTNKKSKKRGLRP